MATKARRLVTTVRKAVRGGWAGRRLTRGMRNHLVWGAKRRKKAIKQEIKRRL